MTNRAFEYQDEHGRARTWTPTGAVQDAQNDDLAAELNEAYRRSIARAVARPESAYSNQITDPFRKPLDLSRLPKVWP